MTNYAEKMNALAKEYIINQTKQTRETAEKYFNSHILAPIEDAARHGKFARVFAITNSIDMEILEAITRDAGFSVVSYPHREMRVSWDS